MDGVPRRSFCGNEVRSLVELRHFIAALIVGRCAAKARGAAHTLGMILAIHHDLREADGVSDFIEHLAGKNGVRGQAQNEVLGLLVGAGDDCD